MSEPAPEQVDLLEGLRTTPSLRYLADTPIPDTVLWELLDTAIRGPSGDRQRSGCRCSSCCGAPTARCP